MDVRQDTASALKKLGVEIKKQTEKPESSDN